MYKSKVYVNSKLFNILLGEKKKTSKMNVKVYIKLKPSKILLAKKKNSFKMNV